MAEPIPNHNPFNDAQKMADQARLDALVANQKGKVDHVRDTLAAAGKISPTPTPDIEPAKMHPMNRAIPGIWANMKCAGHPSCKGEPVYREGKMSGEAPAPQAKPYSTLPPEAAWESERAESMVGIPGIIGPSGLRPILPTGHQVVEPWLYYCNIHQPERNRGLSLKEIQRRDHKPTPPTSYGPDLSHTLNNHRQGWPDEDGYVDPYSKAQGKDSLGDM